MPEVQGSPFQTFVAEAIELLPKARNYYDRILQARLGTTGKPLYDIARKNYRPKRDTLLAVSDVLGQPMELFEQALDGASVDPLPLEPKTGAAEAADRAKREAGHRNDRPERPASQTIDAGEIVSIQRLDLSLPMGPGALVDDYVEEEPVVFDLGYVRAFTRSPGHRLRLVRGIGDSMEPTLRTNDEVWIDTTQDSLLHSDRVYVASINGGATIKRLRPIEGGRRILVIPDNKTIEAYPVDAGEVRIWGRVIKFAREL